MPEATVLLEETVLLALGDTVLEHATVAGAASAPEADARRTGNATSNCPAGTLATSNGSRLGSAQSNQRPLA